MQTTRTARAAHQGTILYNALCMPARPTPPVSPDHRQAAASVREFHATAAV